MKISLAALSTLGLLIATAPSAAAQDILVRVRGIVSMAQGAIAPSSVGLFTDAQAGDEVTLDLRIRPDSIGMAFGGGLLYELANNGSRLSIGTETDALDPDAFGSTLQIGNDPNSPDGFSILIAHSAVLGPLVEATAYKTDGTSLWDSNDPTVLLGQTFDLTSSGLRRFNVAPFAPSGQITMDMTSVEFMRAETVGQNYCTPAPNSTGSAGVIFALGSSSLSENSLVLWAESLPRDVTGFFLGSQLQGFAVAPGGSAGNLCLGGAIGRFLSGGFVVDTGRIRRAVLPLDLGSLATPTANVPAQAGETWNFQLWHRDTVNGQATSNFTDGLSITFS